MKIKLGEVSILLGVISINHVNFYSANIPGKTRLSGAPADPSNHKTIVLGHCAVVIKTLGEEELLRGEGCTKEERL